jgi:hypothetical protein
MRFFFLNNWSFVLLLLLVISFNGFSLILFAIPCFFNNIFVIYYIYYLSSLM